MDYLEAVPSEKLSDILKETIMILCQNSISFHEQVSIEGILGITIDKTQIMLINIKNVFAKTNSNDILQTNKKEFDHSLNSESYSNFNNNTLENSHQEVIILDEDLVDENENSNTTTKKLTKHFKGANKKKFKKLIMNEENVLFSEPTIPFEQDNLFNTIKSEESYSDPNLELFNQENYITENENFENDDEIKYNIQASYETKDDFNYQGFQMPINSDSLTQELQNSETFNMHKKSHQFYNQPHQQVLSSQELFSCKICKKDFTNHSVFLYHKKEHKKKQLLPKLESENYNNELWQEDNKNFFNNVVETMQYENNNWEEAYKPVCSNFPESLNIPSIGKNEKSFRKKLKSGSVKKCNLISKSFLSEENTNSGINQNEKSTVFTCNICGTMVRHLSSFRRHKDMHKGIMFKCLGCNKVFSRRDNLNKHKKTCSFVSQFSC